MRKKTKRWWRSIKKKRQKSPAAPREAVRRDMSRRRRSRRRPQSSAAVRAPERAKKRRRIPSRAVELIYKLLLTAALLCAVGFAASAYFRVRTIEVRGNERCTADAVAAATGVRIGDRLLFVNRKSAAEGIFRALPYADAVRVRRRFPSTLVIELRESVPAAAVLSEGVAYLIDGDCKLLEYMPQSAFSLNILTVDGMTVSGAEPGQTIGMQDELRLDTLRILLKAFAKEELLPHVSALHAEKLYDISFVYDRTLTVRIGDASELERKLELLEAVRKKLNPGERGTLELSEVGTARFRAEVLG